MARQAGARRHVWWIGLCGVMLLAAFDDATGQTLSVYERVRFNVASTSNNLNPNYIGSYPSAIAWSGSAVYVAGVNSTGTTGASAITEIVNPLATPGLGVVPTFSPSFGLRPATANTRGYTGLAVNGGVLAASWDNGTTTPATTDGMQAFATADRALLWTGTLSGRQMGGVAFDPGYVVGGVSQGGAGVAGLVYSSGRRPLFDVATGTNIYNTTSGSPIAGMVINTAPLNTEWRDVDFDPATGDIYSRNANNVARGTRTGPNALAGNAQAFLVNNANNGGATAGQNLSFMGGIVDPAGSFSGSAVIWNDRPASASSSGASVFTNAIRLTATDGTPVGITWNTLFGATPANGNGWYDFGYDSATRTLAVMDFQNRAVSIFDLDVDLVTVSSGTDTPIVPLASDKPVAKRGGGTLAVSQASPFAAGTVYVEEGTLQVGDGGTTGRIGEPVVVTLATGATLAFNRSDDYGGPVAVPIGGNGAVVVEGGRLALTGTNSYTGGTTILSGTLLLAVDGATGPGTVVPLAGGVVTVAPQSMMTVPALDPNAGGVVDVGLGMVTVTGGLSAVDMLTAIVSGRSDGSWTGTSGITSTEAATQVGQGVPRSVGWLDHGDGTVTFAYAAPGDTNLDWSIDLLDVGDYLAAGLFDSGEPAAWNQGDYTYDGFVDLIDVSLYLSTGLFDTGPYNASTVPGALVAVPEPTITVTVLGAVVSIPCLRQLRRRGRSRT